MSLEQQMEAVSRRFEELAHRLNQPETAADPARFRRLMQEYHEAEPAVAAYRALKTERDHLAQAKALLTGEGPLEPDFKQMIQQEICEKTKSVAELEHSLKLLLLPRDEYDGRSVIMEVRSGVGGEEAALFAHSLVRMYSMYAQARRWQMELLSLSETELGGVREAVFAVNGQGAYSRLKFESGVHRVQRVPDTETQGRIHTSTATVAVLPEVDEVDFELNPADIEMQVFRSSGAGGQHVNKTSSAVRLIHKPTGMVVECQQERSQFQNRDKAMQILRSRLYEAEQQRVSSQWSEERRSQVGTGMRNERIRTYNFPQGRLTDHRIGLTLYKLEDVMNGNLDEIIDSLITADQAERLKQSGEAD